MHVHDQRLPKSAGVAISCITFPVLFPNNNLTLFVTDLGDYKLSHIKK